MGDLKRTRPDRLEYYLNIAETVSQRATCLRAQVGAIVVRDDVILSTGYAGAPRGEEDCLKREFCEREKQEIPSGERYELCRSVHAEANALLHAAYRDLEGATMYIYFGDLRPEDPEKVSWPLERAIKSLPCMMCKRLLKNGRVSEVFIRTNISITHSSFDEGRRPCRILRYAPVRGSYPIGGPMGGGTYKMVDPKTGSMGRPVFEEDA